VNTTPPKDDEADDLETLYRRISAEEPGRPSANTRQAILEHAARRAAAKLTRLPMPMWWRPVLVGSLAAAALACVLIGPQYLRRVAPHEAAPVVGAQKHVPPTGAPPGTVHTPPLQAASPIQATPAPAAPAVPSSNQANEDRDVVTVTGSPLRAPSRRASQSAAQERDSAEASPASVAILNVRDSDGRTALMLAVLQNRLDAVEDLLRRHADPNEADNAGVTPLQAAVANNESEIASVLRQAGAH
jgi:hypothetical protein